MSRLLFLLCSPGLLFAQFSTQLSPKTTAAFDQYQKAAEAQFTWKAHYAQIQPGEVKIEPIKGTGSTQVTAGLVHDWVAATLVRNTSVDAVVGVLRDYPNYKTIYAPETLNATVISHNGNQWRIGLKLQKTKVLVGRDAEGTGDLVQFPGSHYADPKFSWFNPVGLTAIVFMKSPLLGAGLPERRLSRRHQ